MTRAAIVNGTQLGTYSRAKLMLMDTGIRKLFHLIFCFTNYI